MLRYSIADILKFETFRRADPLVVAGHQYVDRMIRWLHVSDLPNSAYVLRGGELLLTTGANLGDTADEHRRYIRDLVEHGAAGVAIDFHPDRRICPPSMILAAEQCQLPLIEFRRPAFFVRLTEEVHTAMVQEHHAMLRQLEAMSRGFAELLARGANVRQLVNHLASVVGNPIVLEDAAHQVLAYAPQSPELEEFLGDWERHSRSEDGNQSTWPSLTATTATRRPCYWQAIAARGAMWGRLHVLATAKPLGSFDAQAVERASAAIGLTFAVEREPCFLSNDAHGSLLRAIDLGEFETPAAAYRRARALGAKLEGRSLGALAVQPRNLEEWRARDGHGGVEETRVLYGLTELLRSAARACDIEILVTVQTDHILALLGTAPPESGYRAVDRLGGDVLSRAQKRFPGLLLALGASGDITLESTRHGCQEAREAMRWAAQDSLAPTVVHSQDMGLDRVLLKLAQGPELAAMVERELRPLLDYECRSGMPLISTLRAIIAANGKVNRAARHLYVERRTVYNRIRKIHELIDADLDDTEVSVRLHLALRGLDHLRASTPDALTRRSTPPEPGCIRS